MSETLMVQRLSLSFDQSGQNVIAVDDLSFELNPGETVVLLGESGCGKSMTSLSLMRLLPPEAAYSQRSQVFIGEDSLLDLPEQLMRKLRGRRLAMIFQEPMTALNPVLTIAQQLAEVIPKETLLTKEALRIRMIELLKEVEISDPERRLDQYPHQLSGGQKQRIVIAMALAGRPDVLIADEPTTALDATTQSQILSLLKQLQARYQMSILFITHDLSVVKVIADRVCVMYAGQLVESADVAAFMQQPMHPYAQQLFLSLPSFEKRGERLPAIPGCVPTLDALPSGCRFHPRCAHAFETCQSIVPTLQFLSNGREVRCHLYPQHTTPPPLIEVKQHWEENVHLAEPILRVQDLSVYFDPSHHWFTRRLPTFRAVEEVSFELHKGRTLALVGESGCGKSTICRTILRLQLATKGGVFYRGENIASLHGRALQAFRKKVQIVFQDPFSSMNPRMTIAEILAEGMQAQRMSRSSIQRRQIELLDQVNLPKNSLTRYPHQFSGGQRQRICIARALATNPEILVCDEPTSALDISVQAQILNLLKSLQCELGLSYLFITHNMKVVAYMADEVMVMRNGSIVEKGTCEQVLKHPKAKYTKELLR